jgi:hypothetical protein
MHNRIRRKSLYQASYANMGYHIMQDRKKEDKQRQARLAQKRLAL